VLDPRGWDWPVNSSAEAVEAIGRRKGHGKGFELARAALGSAVDRLELSVYDLDPDEIGTFDFVYVGSLLLHLQNPIRGLERVRSVCRGEVLTVDAVHGVLTALFPRRPVVTLDAVGRPWWRKPNVAGLRRMVEAAGFELIGAPRRLRIPRGAGRARPRVAGVRWAAGREELATFWLGDAHTAVHARPV